MTEQELLTANLIKERIKELDAQIFALFDAEKKRINPFKSFIVRGQIYGNYGSEKEITLTRQDIVTLQEIRQAEKESLQKILEQL